MITITTEDGRVLQYEREDLVRVVRNTRWGLESKQVAAWRVESEQWIVVEGNGKLPGRDTDLAYVSSIDIQRRLP